ncbi:MAG: hypothetical protein QG639_507 [Patescibacteria group bacterium]|jgi:hypothetical protein|nr:hypothetical protein [Patescibacteria group bacterium]
MNETLKPNNEVLLERIKQSLVLSQALTRLGPEALMKTLHLFETVQLAPQKVEQLISLGYDLDGLSNTPDEQFFLIPGFSVEDLTKIQKVKYLLRN